MKKAFLILGSGATSGGFETVDGRDLPTDRGFFSTAVVMQLFNQKTFPALHFFADLQSSKSLEKTWSDIDLSSKLTNNQLSQLRVISMEHEYEKLEKNFQKKAESNDPYRNNLNSQLSWVGKSGCIGPIASWEAVQLILKVYEKIKEKKQSKLSKVLKCILKNSELKGIATFNYDLSVESIWSDVTKKKLYYYDPDHSSGYEGSIPFYKMHGSMNWCSSFEPEKRWKHVIPSDIKTTIVQQEFNQGKFIKGNPDYVKEPTIIAPDLYKQNITLDIQNDLKSILFKKIWNSVWEVLNGVDILVFIGFSFPDTDHHARFLFNTADRQKPFKRIVVNTASIDSYALKNYKFIFGQDKLAHIWGGIKGLIDKEPEFIEYLK